MTGSHDPASGVRVAVPERRIEHARVPALPLIRLRQLWAPRKKLPFPLSEPGTTHWYNARAAIWQGLRALGIGPGDRVIAPAFSCGSEIDTLVQAGVTLDFYRIRDGLDVDLDDIERLCARPARALFVTHFYGVAQPMDALVALAQRHGLQLIEDVSLGLYSRLPDGRPLGGFGDMAVFSLWKSLPVPDGGALHLRTASLPGGQPGHGEPPGFASVAGRLRHLTEETLSVTHPHAIRWVRRRITDPAVNWLVARRERKASAAASEATQATGAVTDMRQSPEAAQAAFQRVRAAWRMSALAAHLLPRVVDDGIVAERRAHFLALQRRILPGAEVTSLIEYLPDLCCPLFYPVVARDPRPFCRHLAAHNIGFFRAWCVFHPAVPWEQFPLEARLKENVVVLPIHQGLDPDDIGHMADVVNQWNAVAGSSGRS